MEDDGFWADDLYAKVLLGDGGVLPVPKFDGWVKLPPHKVEPLMRVAPDGAVSRVALDTGELAPFAKLPPQQFSFRYDDHVMPLAGGDFLAVNHELGTNVAVVRPDDEPVTLPPREPAGHRPAVP
jgi:hypothetical protein